MFAPISDLPIKVNNENHLISLGYIIPDDVKIEEVKEAPQFCYVIQKETEGGKYELITPPKEGESNPIFEQLDTLAKVYTEGFVNGVSYYNSVYNKNAVANDNKIITSK